MSKKGYNISKVGVNMKNQALFFEKLSELISFRTEQGVAVDGMPFGKELYDCLTWFNDLAKDFGLSVKAKP